MKTDDFILVPNSAIVDLTLKELGVLCIIASKPMDCNYSGEQIAQESKSNRKTIYGILKSLEAKGYLKRYKLNRGKMAYALTYYYEQE